MASKTKKELQADVDYLLTQTAQNRTDIEQANKREKGLNAEFSKMTQRMERMARRISRLEKDDE